MVKISPGSAGDPRDSGSIPGSGRSPRKGNDNPLQYSDLESSMDSRAWQATVHGVTESQTQLRYCAHTTVRMQKKKLSFLAASERGKQLYRLDFRPHSPPGPVPFCSEPPTHPYIATLLNPSSREKPICSPESWAPLLPLRKSRASKS